MSKPQQAIRVLVADSQPLFAESLSYALSLTGLFELLEDRPRTGQEAVSKALEHRPDVCLVDYWIKGIEGPAVTSTLTSPARGIKVIILSWMHLPADIDNALAAGASGFLSKESSISQVAEAIQKVHSGRFRVLSTDLTDQKAILKKAAPTQWVQLKQLTPREIEILTHLGFGLKPEEVAQALGVKPLTVKKHLQNMMHKTETNSQLELMALVRHHRVIPT